MDHGDAIEVEGRWVHVRKHSSMGCAVITFDDISHRRALLDKFADRPIVVGGISVELKVHMEKRSDGSSREAPSCAFAGWKQPKEEGTCKLLARTLTVTLDRICDECCPVIALDD